MDVQLSRDIAKRCDVQLVDRLTCRLGQSADQGTGAHSLFQQRCPVPDRELLDFSHAFDPRDQDQPREPGIILQANMAQRPVHGEDRPGVERRVRTKPRHGQLSP